MSGNWFAIKMFQSPQEIRLPSDSRATPMLGTISIGFNLRRRFACLQTLPLAGHSPGPGRGFNLRRRFACLQTTSHLMISRSVALFQSPQEIRLPSDAAKAAGFAFEHERFQSPQEIRLPSDSMKPETALAISSFNLRRRFACLQTRCAA